MSNVTLIILYIISFNENNENKKLIISSNDKVNYEFEKKYFLTEGNVRRFKGHISEEFYFRIHDKLYQNRPIEPYKWKQEELEYKAKLFIKNRDDLCSRTWKNLNTNEELNDYLNLYRILYNKEITKPLLNSLDELQLYLEKESDRLLDIIEDIDNFHDSFEASKPYVSDKNLVKKKKSHINRNVSLWDLFDPLETSYLEKPSNNSILSKEEELKKHERMIQITKTEYAIRINYDDLLARRIEIISLSNRISKLNSIDTYNYKFFYIYVLLRINKTVLLIYFYYILLSIPLVFSIVNIVMAIF